MEREKVFLAVFFMLSLVFLTGGVLAFNPATEEEEFVVIPVDKERNMGKDVDKQVHKHFVVPVDPFLQQRVEEIGKKLACGTDRRDLVYRFIVLEDEKDNYNAFAAPGGYIYIFGDLVEKLKTDDNIAAVLAHEMGHVEAKHALKRMQGEIGALVFLTIGSQMQTKKKDQGKANEAIGQLMAAYSRHDETEADELSVKYLKLAEFDPRGTVNALEALKELRKKAPRMTYSYYRSHPYLSERVAHLNNYINGYPDFNSYVNIATDDDEDTDK